MLNLTRPFLAVFPTKVRPLILRITFLPAFRYLFEVFKAAKITLFLALTLKMYLVLAALRTVAFLTTLILATAVAPL